ncbi:MAG: PAS domain S-box protein [Gallionella sp.]|nr:PAS domain S-box protein [Gallionella sp.]
MDHATHALDSLASDSFMPHGHCYLWTPELLWIFVIAESLIVLSYFSIPFALMYFVSKRRDLQFNWIFKLFSLFIFACGITHLLGIWTIWYPDYWLDALVKAATAMISVVAAVLLWRLMPRALKLPSTQQLEDVVSQLQQEVEQRKSTEAELFQLKAASDERFRVLFDQAAIGVAEVDADTGTFLRINRKYCDILGYSPEEMRSINYRSLIHPDGWPVIQEKLQSLMSGMLPEFSIEERFLHKRGHLIWVELTVSPLRQPSTSSSTYVVIVQDITVRKQAEMTLKEQFDELRRWRETTIGRESRVLELKQEVNELLVSSGQPPRYASVEADGHGT